MFFDVESIILNESKSLCQVYVNAVSRETTMAIAPEQPRFHTPTTGSHPDGVFTGYCTNHPKSLVVKDTLDISDILYVYKAIFNSKGCDLTIHGG